MQKEISVEDILRNMSGVKPTKGDHDSLRYSDDYEPQINRYSKDDQFEELRFTHEGEKTEPRVVQITESQKIKEIVNESSQENRPSMDLKNVTSKYTKFSTQSEEKSIDNTWVSSKKVSLKKSENEFEQDYGNLFDQFFSKTKKTQSLKSQINTIKTQQPPLQVPAFTSLKSLPSSTRTPIFIQQKSAHSLVDNKSPQKISIINKPPPPPPEETMTVNILPPNLPPLSLQKKYSQPIEYVPQKTEYVFPKQPENSINTNNTTNIPNNFNAQSFKKPNVKILFNRQSQSSKLIQEKQVQRPNLINRPSQQIISKPIVTEVIKSNVRQVTPSIPSVPRIPSSPTAAPQQNYNEVIQQQNRLPIFLVKFRQLTNTYPNLMIKNAITPDSCFIINAHLQQSSRQCRKAIKILKQTHNETHQKIKDLELLYSYLRSNVGIRKSEEDKIVFGYFMSKDWNTYRNCAFLQKIKPKDYFASRQICQQEFMTLLRRYEQIVADISNHCKLNPTNIKTAQYYMQARETLWTVEKNLRLMSEDLYVLGINNMAIPTHIVQCQKHIKNQTLKGNKILNEKLIRLQVSGDLFCRSALGAMCIEQSR